MTTAVIAVPSSVVSEVDNRWGKLRMTIAALDGSNAWEITNPSLGVFLRRDGLRGLGMPKVSHMTTESPALPGASHDDLNYKPRDIFWPMQIFHDGTSAEWIERDSQFWDALDPAQEVRWTVYTLDGKSRWIDCRLDNDGDWAPEVDPTYFGWADYGIRMTANSPFWKGDPIRQSWRTTAPVDFYADAPGVIAISSSRSLANARITNPGKVIAYPKWTIRGPIDGATVGVNGHVLEVPIALAEGEYIVLDTNPDELTVTDHTGADRYSEAGELDWLGWVPPRVSTELALTLDGDAGGKVELEIIPQYLRAW